MKHSFQVFDHALKAFENHDKRTSPLYHYFLMFSYHAQTLELGLCILHKLIKDLLTGLLSPVLGNTKSDLFVRPELARDLRESEGFVFLEPTE